LTFITVLWDRIFQNMGPHLGSIGKYIDI